jgi:hypothetical protein
VFREDRYRERVGVGDVDGARGSQLHCASALVVFDGVEGFEGPSSIVTPGLSAAEGSFGLPVPHGMKEHPMFATIRRYDGVDQNRSAELTRKVNETLVPKLEKLSGFAGYWLIEADNGVFSSLSLFETPEQGKESTKIVASWIRDEKLDTMIPNEPKVTSGKVVAHSDRVLVAA